jgi:hypothetical protein
MPFFDMSLSSVSIRNLMTTSVKMVQEIFFIFYVKIQFQPGNLKVNGLVSFPYCQK